MSEQASPGGGESRRRGVGFPQLPLGEAVEAVVTIGQHGASHTQDAAAAYLGHATANSGAFRSKLAALRDWGLLARGDKNRVILSDLARQFVLAAPDHASERQLLLAAFESCRVFGMLYNDSAKNTPLEAQRLRNVVVMQHGVASDQADKFVDSFTASAVYAGLGKLDGSRLTLSPREAAFVVSYPDEPDDRDAEAAALHVTPEPVRSSTSNAVTAATSAQSIPTALRQAWPIDGGEIEFIIRTGEALPPTIWSLVAQMAEVAEEMKVKLTGPYVEITADNPSAAYRTHPAAAEPAGN